MKSFGIINAELSHAIGAMGHTDIMMVVDAGFPIPRDAWRIDLALVPGFPSTELVLKAIAQELIVEKTVVAHDVPENNPPLNSLVQETFPAAEHTTDDHQALLAEYASKAKVVVRTGALNPWGNVALVSGIDAPVWFQTPGVKTPEFYAQRIARMNQGK